MKVPLSCRCGAVQGSVDVAPRSSLHLVCYCDDCRAFAYALDRPDILDENGGSEVCPTTPARLALTAGREHIRCLRLSDRGMYRWYAGCCSTPIANSLPRPGVPFVSIHRSFIAGEVSAFGPVMRVQARFAKGVPPRDAERSASLWTILKTVRFLVAARMRGEHRPNPLLINGNPMVTPRVLTKQEREKLRETA